MEKSERRISHPAEGEAEYPIRLNRFLALSNVSSRREADALIESGRVAINGRKAVLGDKVNAADVVSISGLKDAKKTYIAYAKPKGISTFSREQAGMLGIRAAKEKLAAISDLGKNSEGIVMITNDGRAARSAAESEPEQAFEVRTQESLSPSFLRKLVDGVRIGRNKTDIIKAEAAEQAGDNSFTISLRGGDDAVRKMCEALHHTAVRIKRISFAGITLRGIATGQWKELESGDARNFLSNMGIK